MSVEEMVNFIKSNTSTAFLYGECEPNTKIKHVLDATFGHCIDFDSGDCITMDGIYIHPQLPKIYNQLLGRSPIKQGLQRIQENFPYLLSNIGGSIGKINGTTISFWAKCKLYPKPTTCVILSLVDSKKTNSDEKISIEFSEDNIIFTCDKEVKEVKAEDKVVVEAEEWDSVKKPWKDINFSETEEWTNWAFTKDFEQGVMKIYRGGSLLLPAESKTQRIDTPGEDKKYKLYLGADENKTNN